MQSGGTFYKVLRNDDLTIEKIVLVGQVKVGVGNAGLGPKLKFWVLLGTVGKGQ